MIIGYARVSKLEQNLDLQLDALAEAGCERVFTDRVSGSTRKRPGLGQCLSLLAEGDMLVVWRLDRLGRSMQHLVKVVEHLRERGVHFKSLQEGHIDTSTAVGGLVFHLFGALAQFERQLIIERTMAGLAAARARGQKFGRRRITADDPRVQRMRELRESGLTVKATCALLDISEATYRRWRKL